MVSITHVSSVLEPYVLRVKPSINSTALFDWVTFWGGSMSFHENARILNMKKDMRMSCYSGSSSLRRVRANVTPAGNRLIQCCLDSRLAARTRTYFATRILLHGPSFRPAPIKPQTLNPNP